MRLLLLLLLFSATAAVAYKILLFTPQMSNCEILSHRLGVSLASAGHSVTLLRVATTENRASHLQVDPAIRDVHVNASSGVNGEEIDRAHAKSIYWDLSLWDPETLEGRDKIMGGVHRACENLITNSSFLSWLAAEQFDVAFVHMHDPCPIGVMHSVHLPWIWFSSAAIMDFMADAAGVPSPPSYISTALMVSTDRMSFSERAKSFLGHSLMKIMYPGIFVSPETALFRRHFGPSFPDLVDLMRQCPLVMVNSNELYEFTRPTLHKVVHIGGLGLSRESVRPLAPQFAAIADRALKGVIVFSIGSVAPAHLMPESWKTELLTAFEQMEGYEVIMCYSGSDLADRLPANVHAFPWIPQLDLMYHPSTRVLFSHGGYASLQEAIYAGVPVLTVPLFGDQFKNAKLAESKGFGVHLPNTEFTAENIVASLRRVLEEESFSLAARRLSSLVSRQPVKPEQRLREWTELLAHEKTLPMLVPAGQDLNILQYHSVDVIAAIAAVIGMVLLLLFLFFLCLLRCCFTRCQKSLKTKTQ